MNRHNFLVIETSLPGDGTIETYRRRRAGRRDGAAEGKGSARRLTQRSLVVLLALVCLAAAPPAADAALVGEWTLDEGAGQIAHDRSPLRLDGRLGLVATADGADPTWVPGIAGWALRFDGADAIVLRDSANLEPARVTVEAWVRRQGTPGAYAYVVSKGSRGCDFSSYGLYTGTGGGVAFYVSDGSGYVVSPPAAPSKVWDGAWHHVAGVFDGEAVRLYLDADQVGHGSPNHHPIQYGLESKAPYIGTYRGSCARGFTGDIDDVRIWSSALTATQVSASRPTQPLGPGRPLTPPVPPVSGPPPAADSPRCFVSASRDSLRAGRRNRLVVTVRRGAQRRPGVRVAVTGSKFRLIRRADRGGRARFVVRPPRFEHRLLIHALGSARRCAAATIPVRA